MKFKMAAAAILNLFLCGNTHFEP